MYSPWEQGDNTLRHQITQTAVQIPPSNITRLMLLSTQDHKILLGNLVVVEVLCGSNVDKQ